MAPIIEIKINESQLRNIQKLLRNIPRALPRAMSRAINKTASPVKVSMARQLVGPLNAAMSAVRKRQRKAGVHIIGYFKGAPSTRFTMADMKKNIKLKKATYKVWQALIGIKRFKGQEARESSEPAFVAQMPSGHISIFKRLGSAQIPIADQMRRLMREYFTGIKGTIKQETQQRFQRNIDDQVKLALSQWKAGAEQAA